MGSRYAEGTTVTAEKSRAEIEAVLSKFKATGYQWTVLPDGVTLRFQWKDADGVSYTARLSLPKVSRQDADASLRARGARKRDSLAITAEVEAENRRRHRLLLLKVKGDLVAVQEGLIPAIEVFLPYLETPDGRTVGEHVIPRLREGGGRLLLGGT